MDVEHRPTLTFAALDAKIEALPEGPVSAFNTPRWAWRLTLIGLAGMIAAFVPSLLVQWLAPQPWMVWLARTGFAVTVAAFLPGLLRNLWVLVRDRSNGVGFTYDCEVRCGAARRKTAWTWSTGQH